VTVCRGVKLAIKTLRHHTDRGLVFVEMGTFTKLAALALFAYAFKTSAKVRFYVRIIIMIFHVALGCSYGMIAALVLSYLKRGGESNYFLSSFMTILAPYLYSLDIKVEGREHLEGHRPAVFIWYAGYN
jgi:NhaP-type Na+/H+ or K+/H+ antiporter